MAAKATTARSMVASVCTTGMDIQAPSARVTAGFSKALVAAIRPKGGKWQCYAVLMALCVPGHALDLIAIGHREAVNALRRQADRDDALTRIIGDLRHAAQATDGGGPVARLFQSLHQLDCTWTATGTMHDDWGTKLSWLRLSAGCFGHMLCCSQRRMFTRHIPKDRHDLGFHGQAGPGHLRLQLAPAHQRAPHAH